MKVSRFSDSNDPYELMALAFDSGTIRTAISKFKAEYDQNVGLLCFSSNWASPVLWSHYGDRHRGICLGFNVHKSEAIKVRYADNRLHTQLPDFGRLNNVDDKLRELLICTKFRDWGYEKEIRLEAPLNQAVREGSNFFWKFGDKLQLAEVVLGPLCDLSVDSVRQKVISLYPDVVTYQARFAIKSFSIVPKENTVP